MDSKTSYSQQKLGDASFGAQLLLNMSEKCVELRSVKRQSGTQSRFKEVLNNLRTGDPTYEDATFLMNLHLANMSQEEIKDLTKDKGIEKNRKVTRRSIFAAKHARSLVQQKDQ